MPTSRGRFAVALGLDDAAATAIRRLSQNLEFGRRPVSVPPHVTLAACSGLDVTRFRPLAAELAARSQPLACTLASLGVFPAEGVLFVTPGISADLVQLQVVVLEQLKLSSAEIEPYWTPGHWVPHCTLAIGIPRATMASVVAETLAELHPIASHLVRLSVYAIDPPELCYEFPLGSTPLRL